MYSSKFDPSIPVMSIMLYCDITVLPMQTGFRILDAGVEEIRHTNVLPILYAVGWGIQSKRVEISVATDHEYFHYHVEKALKKAYEYVANLHGNTHQEITGFDLFA